MSLRALCLVSCLVTALTVTPRRCAAQQPPTREALALELGGFEREPDVAAVRAWGAQGAASLMALGNDPQAQPHVRQRALHALRAFTAQPAVRDYLRRVASLPQQELFTLRAALDALVEGFDDVAFVARFLGDARADVRDGAAWSLSRSAAPAAATALRERLAREPDEAVRRTLGDALQRRQAR